ncbi:hypothetical protein [Marinovum sp.]|uniref:hypothetical protein n=1 Tax=Marinovum sp. TaxID=2024839 RepID=UPI002B265D72|nr:hypothetical protein [Marinovum sp.]
MQREIVDVPRGLLRLLEVDWDIDWRGQGLRDSADGVSTAVINRFPRWIGSPRVVLEGDRLRAWRAIRAEAQGLVGLYRVPMVDPVGYDYRQAVEDAGIAPAGVPFSTGESFSHGHGFAYDPVAQATADFAAGAPEITIDTASAGALPRVGQILSHDDRPFLVTAILTTSGTECTIRIQLPLRTDLPEGGLVQMQARGIFEAAEQQMGNPSYGLDLVSRVRLSFREYLGR